MKRKVLLLYFILFWSCGRNKIYELKLLLVSFNKSISSSSYNLIKSHSKEKYKLRIFMGNIFQFNETATIKRNIKMLNKLRPDIYLPDKSIYLCEYKKIKKYQRICRFPLILTNPPFSKKYSIIFKPFIILNLLKFRLRIYNILNFDSEADAHLSETCLTNPTEKEIIIIFSNRQEIVDKLFGEFYNKISIIVSKNIKNIRAYNKYPYRIIINPSAEIIGELKIYYSQALRKISAIEFDLLNYSSGTSL